MSQNVSLMLAIVSTNGTRKFHAVNGGAKSLNRNYTYAQPVCGLRGRDSYGSSTTQLVDPKFDDIKTEFLEFDTARTDARYAANYTVCARCARIADRIAGGESFAEATAIRPPEINAKTRAAIEASQDTPLDMNIVKDQTLTDNITGRTAREIVAVVKSAPMSVETEYNNEYRADVSYPALPHHVRIRIDESPEEGTSVYSYVVIDYLHPKTMKPVTGAKLARLGTRYEGAEIDHVRKMIGI